MTVRVIAAAVLAAALTTGPSLPWPEPDNGLAGPVVQTSADPGEPGCREILALRASQAGRETPVRPVLRDHRAIAE